LVADVVVVVGVVGEFDINGPDSLGFGAAFASAAAPMTTMPARQLVAKSLRIMIHTLFQVRTLGAPHALCTNGERHRVQVLAVPGDNKSQLAAASGVACTTADRPAATRSPERFAAPTLRTPIRLLRRRWPHRIPLGGSKCENEKRSASVLH
jgi:hypothetical protein